VSYPPLAVKVSGPYALFTRPEQKLERVSYQVMTPSAARGILEAIFFHKPMRWRIREIQVLKPVRHFSILRNEVASRMSPRRDGLSISDERSQKHTLGLRDVAYIIKADIWIPPGLTDERGRPVDPAKYRDQFRRRVQRGQCFHRPYLGCREFAADFREPDGSETPIAETADLGRMLFDIEYGDKNTAHYFDAVLENGCLAVPAERYDELHKTELRKDKTELPKGVAA
jgi:CRISPR-associated protein Cas5d